MSQVHPPCWGLSFLLHCYRGDKGMCTLPLLHLPFPPSSPGLLTGHMLPAHQARLAHWASLPVAHTHITSSGHSLPSALPTLACLALSWASANPLTAKSPESGPANRMRGVIPKDRTLPIPCLLSGVWATGFLGWNLLVHISSVNIPYRTGFGPPSNFSFLRFRTTPKITESQS